MRVFSPPTRCDVLCRTLRCTGSTTFPSRLDGDCCCALPHARLLHLRFRARACVCIMHTCMSECLSDCLSVCLPPPPTKKTFVQNKRGTLLWLGVDALGLNIYKSNGSGVKHRLVLTRDGGRNWALQQRTHAHHTHALTHALTLTLALTPTLTLTLSFLGFVLTLVSRRQAHTQHLVSLERDQDRVIQRQEGLAHLIALSCIQRLKDVCFLIVQIQTRHAST